ncbi:MAG: NADH-quinone oxidoreductase subunit A [Candidatus Marinimicrobia bacterium]|nr:NADH-quinone oxidoreductase subunit A [Candidatus Neomarinimicrobiota bacterium]
MIQSFAVTFIYIVLSLVLLVVVLQLARLMRPTENRPEDDEGRKVKYMTYECGIEIKEDSWIQFNVRFYVIALIFIIFDVEALLLFPWAVVFSKIGMVAFFEMLIFLSILALGLAYVWVKGDLDWVKVQVKNGGKRYNNMLTENEA